MRDYEEKSYYEIQLDNKQLILVFLAGVTVCVLIFVLGVMVGKGKKETEMALAGHNDLSPKTAQRDMKMPQEPSVAADEPDNSDKDKKTKKDKTAKEAKNQKGQEYSFYDLDKPETKDSNTMEKDSSKESAKQPSKPDESVKTAEPEVKTKPAASEVTAADSAGGERYTVQVMATASKDKAEQQLNLLKAKGYTAFLDADQAGSGSVYKVRVGKFKDSDSAKKMASRLKEELKLETWVAVLD